MGFFWGLQGKCDEALKTPGSEVQAEAISRSGDVFLLPTISPG